MLHPSDKLEEELMLRGQRIEKENSKVSKDDDGKYKVQASPTLGGILFNFRGDSTEEVVTNIEEFAKLGDRFFDAYDTLRQVTLAKSIGTAAGYAAPNTAPQSQHAAPAAGSTQADLRCKHGPYKDLNGKRKKNGEGYQSRYVCAAPFGAPDQCAARSLPGQEPWSA